MNTQCSIDLLESALVGNMPREREELLLRHLEGCEQCAATLEQMAGGEAGCRQAAAMLAPDDLADIPPAREEWSDADFIVEHLEPPDEAHNEPNVLGRLGGYDVMEIIGRGGMGIVLKGYDRELKRCVAIKVLSPHLAQSSLARKRFAREAQAAAAVVHHNVLAIHQVQPNGRLPFLVMPLVAGESLAQRLARQGRLEIKETLRIGLQAAAGLAAAHEQGLVHRDVKPANILLEKGVERAVLTDFGLARAADDVSMTRWGIIAGTPQYMSPEQARGALLDGRSDLFSLGCVLYEMATGESPFHADSTLATLRRVIDDPAPSMASLNAELPPWFIAIVDKLLSKDPAQRFASAKEVSELLEACLAHLQQPTSVPLPKISPLPPVESDRMGEGPGVRAVVQPRKRFVIGTVTMLSILTISLFATAVVQTTPPGITGNWTGEGWGQVVLTQTAPGQYVGTYTDTVAKGPGKIELKWSRIECRFNGTWSEGDDRFGDLSIRLVDKEIRGALTTDVKSKINPATPRLADLSWTRGELPSEAKSTPASTRSETNKHLEINLFDPFREGLTDFDLGTLARGTEAEHRFLFENRLWEDVHIVSAHSSCACATVEIPDKTYKPGEKCEVLVKMNTLYFLGERNATITVQFDKPHPAEAIFTVRAFVRSDVDIRPGAVNLRIAPEPRMEQRVNIRHVGSSEWRIKSVESSPNSLVTSKLTEVKRADGQIEYNLIASLAGIPNVPITRISDRLTLITNDTDPRLQRITIPVEIIGAASGDASKKATWNVTNDLSIKNGNPNGGWTYGWVRKSKFVPYTSTHDDKEAVGWHTELAGSTMPGISVWRSGFKVPGTHAGQFGLHPGPHNEASVVRWTAPYSCNVHVRGQFYPGDIGIMQVGVFVNSTPQVTKPYWHASDSGKFDFILTVSKGDTIDFAVYDGYSYGSTPLEATITSISESESQSADPSWNTGDYANKNAPADAAQQAQSRRQEELNSNWAEMLAAQRERAAKSSAAWKKKVADANELTTFPNHVPFEVGATYLIGGDQITIDEVRGTADTIMMGHSYEVKGRYHLASHSKATLAAYTTSNGTDTTVVQPTKISAKITQRITVEQGDGKFTLLLRMSCKGWPHLSFYPASGGESFASVYFGIGDSLLKHGWWEKKENGKERESLRQPSDAEGEATADINKQHGGAWIEKFPQGTVELIGITDYPLTENSVWWKPDGSPAKIGPFPPHQRPLSASGQQSPKPPGVQLMPMPWDTAKKEKPLLFIYRLKDLPADSAWPVWSISPAKNSGCMGNIGGHSDCHLFYADVGKAADSVKLRVGIDTGPWDTVVTQNADHLGLASYVRDGRKWNVTFEKAQMQKVGRIDEKGTAIFDVDATQLSLASDEPYGSWGIRLLAITRDGAEHASWIGGFGGHGSAYFQRVPLSSITEYRLQARPYTWVEFLNVAVQPSDSDSAAGKRFPDFIGAQLPSFGPVFERTLHDPSEGSGSDRDINFVRGKDSFIRFENGEMPIPPADMQLANTAAVWQWAKSHHVDAVAETVSSRGLLGYEMDIDRISDDQWEHPPSAEEMRARIGHIRWNMQRFGRLPTMTMSQAVMTVTTTVTNPNQSKTYIFEIRNGTLGILQFLDYADSPKGFVKFRYKLLRTDAENTTSKGTAARPTLGAAKQLIAEPVRATVAESQLPEVKGTALVDVDAQRNGPWVAKLARGTVELVGIADYRLTERLNWWKPDGSSADFSRFLSGPSTSWNPEERSREFLLRIKDLPFDSLNPIWKIEPTKGSYVALPIADEHGKLPEGYQLFFAEVGRSANVARLCVGVENGPWETVVTLKAGIHEPAVYVRDGRRWSVSLLKEETEKRIKGDVTLVSIKSDELQNYHRRMQLVAVAVDGSQQVAWINYDGSNCTAECKLSAITEYRLQEMPYTWVEFRNVPLQPSKRAGAPVEPAAENISSATRKIIDAIRSPTTIECADTPLTEVLDYLEDLHRIVFRYDKDTLDSAGFGKEKLNNEMLVTCDIKGTSLHSALHYLLGQLGLTYVIKDDVVWITTNEESKRLIKKGALDPAAFSLRQDSRKAIEAALQQPAEFNFVERPLSVIVNELGKRQKIVMIVDYRSLKAANIKYDTPVTMINNSRVPLATGLRTLLGKVGLTYVMEDDYILITVRAKEGKH